MKKLCIIGGGACGLLLAGLAKDKFEVTILEKNNKLGKKILASGNGKCNFTNTGDYENKYNSEFANVIISNFSDKYLRNYFASLGLAYRIDEENRVYPLSESSSSILEVLKSQLKGVKILLESKVKQFKNEEGKVRVFYNDTSEVFDCVVCASGSSASNLGSGLAYDYLTNSGVKLTELNPSLTPIRVQEDVSKLNGVRVKCLVTLYKDETPLYKERGEVLFKEDGLSGIVIFNISSVINHRGDGKYTLSLNLLSDRCNKDYKLEYSVHPKLVDYLKDKNPEDLRFTFDGLYDEVNAQVISGGVDLSQVNEDLSYKDNRHIYFGGESLDIDGMCGGYNLQFAFSCAFTINESLKKVSD